MEARASCIAIDIGASGGRVFSCVLERGALSLVVLGKFPNGVQRAEGRTLWDYGALASGIQDGMSAALGLSGRWGSVGVDTWGVDFALLDSRDSILGQTRAYRDVRTVDSPRRFSSKLPLRELYAVTGTQILSFNTVFQLETIFHEGEIRPDEISCFLMVPDYFHFLLCGAKVNEMTDLSTTALCKAGGEELAPEILSALGMPREAFPPAVRPGTRLGSTREGIPVIAPATHDTASAVAALPVPGERNALFLSSGTWSLIGVELDSPILTDRAFALNYTNELSADGRIRFLKNIMGLWLLQRLRDEEPGNPSFADLENAARGAVPFRSVIDANDARFLDPPSMGSALREACAEAGQPIPTTAAERARCVYDSLAASYATAVREIAGLTGLRFERVHVIGGGSRDSLLNQLTADASGMNVLAGPADATAIGNCLCQLVGQGAIEGLDRGRALVRSSFPVVTHKPRCAAPGG